MNIISQNNLKSINSQYYDFFVNNGKIYAISKNKKEKIIMADYCYDDVAKNVLRVIKHRKYFSSYSGKNIKFPKFLDLIKNPVGIFCLEPFISNKSDYQSNLAEWLMKLDKIISNENRYGGYVCFEE